GLVSDDPRSLIKRVGSILGIGAGTASSLLGAAAGLVTGGLRKFSKSRGGLDASSLSTALLDESASFRDTTARAPAAPASAAGTSHPAHAKEPQPVARSASKAWWLLALIPILLIGTWLFQRARRDDDTRRTAPGMTDRDR